MRVVLIIIWCCWALRPGFAQISAAAGMIQGAVSDVSGSGVASAIVIAQNVGTGTRRTTQTDSSGNFALPSIAIGTWKLSASAPGFSTSETEPFQVSVGQVVVRRIQLQLEGIVEKLDVTESPDAIEAQSSSASVTLGSERIEEAPARSRNYLNFVLAAPAVAPSAGSPSQRTMTGVRSPVPDTGFTFGGMRPRNNSIQIDGMDNRDETSGGNRVAVGLEMVEEFRVSALSVGAELGGAAGGVLNMVTRSGVNLVHGDVTGFMQNGALNADRPEMDQPLDPQFRRYQPGVSLLGPLRRDQTFAAAAVEHERETADEFSNVPATAAEFLATHPLGQRFGVARGLYETSSRGTELSAKVDHHIGSSGALWVRYAFSRGRVLGEVQGPTNFADRSAQGNSLTTDHSLVGSWMRVISPTLVNDVRVQVGQRSMALWPNSRGPMFEVPGVVTFGQYFGLDADRRERHIQLVENFQFVAGSHRFSSGVDIHSVSLDASLRNRYAGVFVFPTLDDLRSGRPDLYLQGFGEPRTQMRTLPFGLWLQDRWEVLTGLTVELGLRYDHQIMPARLPRSSQNLSPRIGVAWRPYRSKPLVLRVGGGLFFDRYPLAFLNDALQKDGLHGFEQYAVGRDAAAAFAASAGEILAMPLTGLPISTYRASQDFPSTHSRKISTGLEYGFGSHTSLTVEASTVRGFHLPRVRNAAGTLPPSYLLEQTARSAYSGVTVSLNRRLTHDLAWLASYTYGRAKDDGSDFDEHPQNPLDTRADWSRSRQEQRHRFSASVLFELPVDELEWMPEWLRSALERISIAPIFTAGSGRPINALLTNDAYRTGAFPISARPAGFARNPFLSPRTINLDARVMKTIPIHAERALLQFGVESFNLLNHTNVERVSPYYSTDRGQLSSYGAILESLPARQLQLMIQFEF